MLLSNVVPETTYFKNILEFKAKVLRKCSWEISDSLLALEMIQSFVAVIILPVKLLFLSEIGFHNLP